MAMTQRKLSKILDISPMAVSRVMRGETGVSTLLRARIMEAAKSHGMQIPRKALEFENDPAHHSRRDVIAVITQLDCSLGMDGPEQPFAQKLLVGIQRQLRQQDCEMVVCNDKLRHWPKVVDRKEVDGVILTTPWWHGFHTAKACPVPVVTFFISSEHDLVGVDNFACGELMGKYLVQHSHQRAAYIGPLDRLGTTRLAGVKRQMRENDGGVPVDLCFEGTGYFSFERAYEQTQQIIKKLGPTPEKLREHFTAIVGYNDEIALGVHQCLVDAGIRVPKDISICGFDHVVPKGRVDVGLATVAMPLEEMGAEAVRLLDQRMRTPNAPRRQVLLDTVLMPGKTVGAAC